MPRPHNPNRHLRLLSLLLPRPPLAKARANQKSPFHDYPKMRGALWLGQQKEDGIVLVMPVSHAGPGRQNAVGRGRCASIARTSSYPATMQTASGIRLRSESPFRSRELVADSFRQFGTMTEKVQD